MKQSFNLLKEFVTKYVCDWNKIQAKNGVLIEIEVDEEVQDITLYNSKETTRFGSTGSLLQGVFALGWTFFFKWNKDKERLELIIF